MKVLVATAMYPTPENPAFGSFVRTQIESLQRIGVDAEPFVLTGQNRKLMYARAVRDLRVRLRSNHVDVVHAHYSYVGMVARMQHSVPVVLTFHGDDLLGTVGPSGRTTNTSKLISGLGRALARRVDAVIVQSDQMARELPRVNNLHVLPHEVDLEVFAPTDTQRARLELGLHLDRRYLLFAASPDVPVKNYPFARDVAERIRQVHPDSELLVVHREPQPRLALYMSACDVLLFPSYQEGSPNIVKQAMACNLPIVASDVGDVEHVIGTTPGCTTCPLDLDTFVAAARQVLERPERTRGRGAVLDLAPDQVARRLTAVYESVLINHEASRTTGVR
jgi:glycosyltransferase involved in cell wall biosynthesis